jgi:hypothetical protein
MIGSEGPVRTVGNLANIITGISPNTWPSYRFTKLGIIW